MEFLRLVMALWMALFQRAHQLPLSTELASLQLSIEITYSTVVFVVILAALRQATPFPALLCLKR